MIQFKTLRYKNILSTGNAYTSINLDGKSSTLISGANGSGKSTFLDAIVFGLYGKPFRKINKPQLLNSINGKELEVEVIFTVGGSEYIIRRGIRPNIFEIIKDGTLLNQDSAKKDYQAFLEQNILGINYKSFNQIVVLGSATYVPFMDLPAQTRRDIIEDLLDIQVFSTMGLLAKDKISQNKEAINDNRYQGEILESNITLTEANNKAISKIRQTEVDKIKDKMQEHIVKIEEKQELIESIETIINDLISQTADKPTVKSKLEKTLGVQRDLENARRGHEKEILFYHDNDNCPTCKQGIDHEFKTEITAEKEGKTKELEEGISKLEIKITEFRDRTAEISDLEDAIKTKNLDISENRGEIRISKNALKSYKEELQGAEQELGEIDKSGLAQLKNDFDTILKDRETLFEDQSVLSVVSTILKDGGIKTRIIRQYIPVMNKLINKYLSAFELFVDFHLDENFNEVIRSRCHET